MGARKGRPGSPEITYIKQLHSEGMTIQEIAKQVNRTEEAVLNIVAPKSKVEESIVEIATELETSPEWKMLQGEFSAEELNYFKHRYAKYVKQFQNDVLATEETQIFQVIKLEILMNRNLKGSKSSLQHIAKLERVLTTLYEKYPDFSDAPDSEKQTALTLESQLLTSKSAHQTKSTEFVKLQDKHSALFKELKATREQRIRNVSDQQHTFLGLLRQFQDEDWRKKEGRQLALAQAAGIKAYDDLGKHHKYADGQIDQPILSEETVNDP